MVASEMVAAADDMRPVAWLAGIAIGTIVIWIAVHVRRDARRLEADRIAKASATDAVEEAGSDDDLPPPPEVVRVTDYLHENAAAEVVARLEAAGIPAVAVFHSANDVATGRGGATQVGTVVVVPPDRQPEAVELLDPLPPEGDASAAEIARGFLEGEPLPPDHPDPGLVAGRNARGLLLAVLILGLAVFTVWLLRR